MLVAGDLTDLLIGSSSPIISLIYPILNLNKSLSIIFTFLSILRVGDTSHQSVSLNHIHLLSVVWSLPFFSRVFHDPPMRGEVRGLLITTRDVSVRSSAGLDRCCRLEGQVLFRSGSGVPPQAGVESLGQLTRTWQWVERPAQSSFDNN